MYGAKGEKRISRGVNKYKERSAMATYSHTRCKEREKGRASPMKRRLGSWGKGAKKETAATRFTKLNSNPSPKKKDGEGQQE